MSEKAKSVKCFAVAQRDVIRVDRIESWTDEGRTYLIQGLNRAAGERVIAVRISEIR